MESDMDQYYRDLLARRAGQGASRRTSLAALGAAAIGAALTGPAPAGARKRRKKRKKRRKTCGKKRRKQCNQDKTRCRSAVEDFCQGLGEEPTECAAIVLPCCETCDVTDGLLCLLNGLPD